MAFHRIFIVDFTALGIGESPDANRYQSIGADTLGHVAEVFDGELHLPTLQQLGLGNIRIDHPLPGIPAVDNPIGFFGLGHIAANINGEATGLRESWDFTNSYHTDSVFDTLQTAGYEVTIASRFIPYLEGQALTNRHLVGDNKTGFSVLYEELDALTMSVVYVQLPDFKYTGEAGETLAFGQHLVAADRYLEQFMHDMNENDLLIITSSQASDPMFQSVGSHPHLTREYMPILVYSPTRPNGHSLGIRRTLADIGATVMENFGMDYDTPGHSFLNEITQ
ncbi:phosphopentomutase [Levilactobacillus bambusae]|uniref:Phosphopentomutase n=1 Tax=Levilactobacillus bambusae TaxID=2024736 RepID=A0A2V1MY48_9LACO|nr:phosphopentomutase [Levilactobacillus bambusae]PWF99751.1 phosphopentomutase [Levilactobacillus bambusae]